MEHGAERTRVQKTKGVCLAKCIVSSQQNLLMIQYTVLHEPAQNTMTASTQRANMMPRRSPDRTMDTAVAATMWFREIPDKGHDSLRGEGYNALSAEMVGDSVMPKVTRVERVMSQQ